MRQYEAVILAMKQAGGYATLGQLYQSAPNIPGSEWKTKTPFASIRRIVQEHEAFFKVRPGVWALTAEREKVSKVFADTSLPVRHKEYSHYFYQGLVVELGNLKGFRTFVPAQDKNKPYGRRNLGEVATTDELSPFTYPQVLRRARSIDVTWLNDRHYPDSFFEIEHSTDIQHSLMKFTEFQDFRTRFYIVADARRRAEYDDKLSWGVFAPIKPFLKFWDYDSLVALHSKVSESVVVQQAML